MPGGLRLQLGIIRPCLKRDRKSGKPICLYSKRKPRKLLGRHGSKASALRQEQAIQIRKNRG
jgi:hypothetical protein